MGLHGQSKIMGMGLPSPIEFKGSLSELCFLFLLYIYRFSVHSQALKIFGFSIPLLFKVLSLWFSVFQSVLFHVENNLKNNKPFNHSYISYLASHEVIWVLQTSKVKSPRRTCCVHSLFHS
ncbi:hypothetical protein RchiOBHm_Chr1g0348541 [Rosa chinensis]|uniref:Uncharacterized protein n=1 Tax=Rosa chinensis TaxID=74649 RepID=A0A2P6SFM3_ROSCH|nr:hypothetical protein RchiOBHm_Chr1g0348541 [Rosa chinensis]